MPAKAYENTLGFCLSRRCLRVLSAVFCCFPPFLMTLPLLFVRIDSTGQFSVSPAYFVLPALLFFLALLAAFLLPTRMFAVQKDALCMLSGMDTVRQRVATGSIRALYIVGAAETFRYVGWKRLGRWEKGSKGQKRKFVYLPSVLVYDTAQEGVYRGKCRTHYNGFVYASPSPAKIRRRFGRFCAAPPAPSGSMATSSKATPVCKNCIRARTLPRACSRFRVTEPPVSGKGAEWQQTIRLELTKASYYWII